MKTDVSKSCFMHFDETVNVLISSVQIRTIINFDYYVIYRCIFLKYII